MVNDENIKSYKMVLILQFSSSAAVLSVTLSLRRTILGTIPDGKLLPELLLRSRSRSRSLARALI